MKEFQKCFEKFHREIYCFQSFITESVCIINPKSRNIVKCALIDLIIVVKNQGGFFRDVYYEETARDILVLFCLEEIQFLNLNLFLKQLENYYIKGS